MAGSAITCVVCATGAGNTASSSGLLQTRPSTACRATSHHKRTRVDGGRPGSSRHTPHTRPTSTALCTLVQPSRTSSSIISVSMAQPSRLRDCNCATSASSSASSWSLTSALCDMKATNGDTEPCRVFSTKLATAPCTTLSWPLVAA